MAAEVQPLARSGPSPAAPRKSTGWDPDRDFRRYAGMSGLFQSCQETLERTYGCKAAYSHSVAVYNPHGANTAWDGYVGVFDLTGHPTAVRAYAWSCLSSDGQNRTLCILHAGSVTGPEEAMKALLISETKGVFGDFDSR